MKEISIKILDQKNSPSCIAFAVSGLGNYYLSLKGIDDEIDPIALFNETERGGNGANAIRVLNWGKETGLPTKTGRRFFIREWQSVAQSISQIEKGISQHGGLVFTYDIHDKDPLQNRLKDGLLTRAPLDTHAMILCGYDEILRRFKVANSWGTKFGKDGYMFMPYSLMSLKYLNQVFWFSLK